MSVFSVISTSNIAFYSGRWLFHSSAVFTDSDSDFDERVLCNSLLSSSVAGVAVFIRTAHKFAYG